MLTGRMLRKVMERNRCHGRPTGLRPKHCAIFALGTLSFLPSAMTTENSNSSQNETLVDCLPTKHSVTLCAECGTPFVPASKVNRFCSSACRQAGYRKSPAHQACLAGHKHQRHNRRMTWMRRKNAFKSLSFDGRYAGSGAVGVPRLGELDLKKFSTTDTIGNIRSSNQDSQERLAGENAWLISVKPASA